MDLNTTTQIIPAWTISILAFLSAIGIILIRPIPILIRISLIVPIMYLGILYVYISLIPMGQVFKSDLVRLGLVAIFSSTISNSVLFLYAKYKGVRL